MDIYDFKNMGHSGFENCRIVDSDSYSDMGAFNGGLLFEGDLDEAPDCLDDLEVTSIDVCVWKGQIHATIDVQGVEPEHWEMLGYEPEGEEE